MNFARLEVVTDACSSLETFYSETLDLPVDSHSQPSFTTTVGRTQWRFSAVDSSDNQYHIALLVDADVERVVEWLTDRTSILTVEGDRIVEFPSIKAHSVYFVDPAGSILEFVCPFGATGHYDPTAISGICEVGLPAHDPLAVVEELTDVFGTPVWRDMDETFTRVGDINGRFLVSAVGREWFPTEQPAIVSPLSVVVQSAYRAEWTHSELPYEVVTTKALEAKKPRE